MCKKMFVVKNFCIFAVYDLGIINAYCVIFTRELFIYL